MPVVNAIQHVPVKVTVSDYEITQAMMEVLLKRHQMAGARFDVTNRTISFDTGETRPMTPKEVEIFSTYNYLRTLSAELNPDQRGN